MAMIYKKFGTSSELINAITQDDLSHVASLLSEGADPNAPDERGWRPLHAAIGHVDFEKPIDYVKSIDFVRLLLEHGANVNEWDVHHNETPILSACDPPNIAAARLLLEAGADPNARRSDGESPLRLCAAAQDLEMVRLLLQYGAGKTINEYGGVLAWTALAHAASNFDIPMIELLLRAGADPGLTAEFGETARDSLPPREQHDPQAWDRVMEMLGRRNT
jgi:ankyrin repeat protein